MVAAGRTVDADRDVHSLHGCYCAPATPSPRSGHFASFCGALPGSFDPSSGYPDLPSLADALDQLCHGLKYTHYHHPDGRDDINCP